MYVFRSLVLQVVRRLLLMWLSGRGGAVGGYDLALTPASKARVGSHREEVLLAVRSWDVAGVDVAR